MFKAGQIVQRQCFIIQKCMFCFMILSFLKSFNMFLNSIWFGHLYPCFLRWWKGPIRKTGNNHVQPLSSAKVSMQLEQGHHKTTGDLFTDSASPLCCWEQSSCRETPQPRPSQRAQPVCAWLRHHQFRQEAPCSEQLQVWSVILSCSLTAKTLSFLHSPLFFIISVCSALFCRDLARRGLVAAVYCVRCRLTVIGITHEHVRDCCWNDSLCSDLTSSHLRLCSVMTAAEDADG